MKKLFVVFALIFIGVLYGCKNDNRDLEQEKTEVGSAYIADYLEITSEKDQEFIVLRVKDDYLEVTREYEWVYAGKGGKYPELADGQVARVKADVDVYDGGEAGYTGNKFITDLKQYEVLDYKDVVYELDIPSCEGKSGFYGQDLLQYQDGEKLYFIILNRNYIRVYLDGTFIMEYKYDDLEDELEPFWTDVIKRSE